MIYLDNAATTYPKPECVYKAMDDWNRNKAVNAGRGDYRKAREASELISETKNLLRKLIHADKDAEVIFSPSATVAANQIINGIRWKNNATVYVSPYEHNAVARTLYFVSKKYNIVIKQMPIVSDTLEIDIEKLKYQFSKDKPDAVFCTHISNVTGYILPVKEIFEVSKKYECITVLDTAQSLGLLDIDVKTIKADFLIFAGHKTLYGPFGIGGFINISNVSLNEFITGGTGSDSLNLQMPKLSKFEAGSSNILAIAGLNVALKELDQEAILQHETLLTHFLIEELKKIGNIHLFLQKNAENQIGIVSFYVKGYSSEEVGIILDEDFDIAVRTGYHCAPYIHEFLNDKNTLGTVRVSIGQFTKESDVVGLIEALSTFY